MPSTALQILGDETRTAQIIHNLLDNACRFTDAGGSVGLTVGTEGDQAVVTIQDTGIGIEPAVLKRLFQPFEQADHGLERTRGGLGLGLSVVKTLVELHGGQVEVASEGPGHGTTFTVRLPLASEPPALSAPPPSLEAVSTRLKILVVEDNRDAADSLRMLLQVFGHEVAVAYTGPEGIARATAWTPDVVLSDIGLPGLDGYALAAALRQNPATARARLVALSGYTSEEDLRRSREAGFEQHLGKPADPERLLRLLGGA
jgi:CheY-like chemotaxis protein